MRDSLTLAAGLGMLFGGMAMLAQAAPAGSPVRLATLQDGTWVNIRQKESVSSGKQKVGEHILFEVAEDVKVDGVVVISKGTPALATVTISKPRRMFGRPGALQVRLDYTRLVDGEMVPLDAEEGSQGKSRTDTAVGTSLALGAAFPPAMVVPLLLHGSGVTFPEGTGLWAFVKGDLQVDLSRMHPAAVPALVTGAPAEPKSTEPKSTEP